MEMLPKQVILNAWKNVDILAFSSGLNENKVDILILLNTCDRLSHVKLLSMAIE